MKTDVLARSASEGILLVAEFAKNSGSCRLARILGEFGYIQFPRLRFGLVPLLVLCTSVAAQSFAPDVEPLIDASCIDCHDAATKTRLDFEKLDHDLANAGTFRQWERIFDRVQKGEMPPRKKPRPAAALIEKALSSLGNDLRATNLKQQETNGRVPSRRLTRLEFEYTLQDLLGIRGDLARHLPPENVSSSFDTIAVDQGISPVHIRSYLAAADAALDEAIELGPKPRAGAREMDYRNNRYSSMWFERPIRNGGMTVMKTKDAYVMFEFKPHVAQSNNMGYEPRYPGLYRITAEAYGYQAKTPVTFGIYRSSDLSGISKLIGAFELVPGKTRTIELTEFFTPTDFFYPAALDINWAPDGKNIYQMRVKGAKGYKGEGLAIKWLKIEGPLEEEWPPARTRELLHGVPLRYLDKYRVHWPNPSKEPREHLRDIIGRLLPLAFRRPVTPAEIESFVSLAKPHHPKDHPIHKIVRVPLRAMFSSPQFLLHSGNPGRLDDHALATRLSYFLWKSLPDDELFALAEEKKLSQPEILTGQVNRMLNDPRSNRFVNDFLNGWLGLRAIDATTPDEKLYPEYDDTLRQAMLSETRLVLRELIKRDLSARNFIDSDFTFLNRRLATHYGIPGVAGEHMRRVSLPTDSVRGGLLTHASVLKVTANGTVSSPVKRGNFVLSTLLGTPPSPPPANVDTPEPDTRGTRTMRELLAKHRDVEACANCHRHIDPPGFALESLDPIGGYRTRYRTTGKGDRTKRRLYGRRIYEYREGLRVDSSGTTNDGRKFTGIREFKKHLLAHDEQVARHFISQLVVYATGGEIQFADREEIERIVRETKPDAFPVRSIIHQVVQSKLFRSK